MSTKSLLSLLSFAGGEWSSKLSARADQEKYASALRQCLNMIPYKSGGLTRRPGTKYIAAGGLPPVDGHNYSIRLQKFVFSPDTTFMLEFGHRYVRFYSNRQPVTINTASQQFWVNIYAYDEGDYVQFSGVCYYCIAAVSSRIPPFFNPPPNTDPTHWVVENALRKPTPYAADAGVLGLPVWANTEGYTTGTYVQFGGTPYICTVTVGAPVNPATNPNPSTDTDHWTVQTPPSTFIYQTQIWQLSFCQINDVVYLVHPQFPPYKLTRVSDVDWTIGEVAYLTPPLLDRNATNTTIQANATTGTVTLTAAAPAWAGSNFYQPGNSVEVAGVIYNAVVPHVSDPLSFANDLARRCWQAVTGFDSLNIGSTWQLAYLRASSYIEYTGTAAGGFTNGTSGTIKAFGDWEVHSYGTWSSDISIEQSLDDGQTWNVVRSSTGRNDRNVDLKGTAFQASLYRIVVGGSTAPPTPGSTNPRIVFEIVDSFLFGLVKITGYTSATVVTGEVVTELFDTSATQYWSEAAWSDRRGYPQAVASFQQRVIYGASAYEPQRIWGTVTNDIENFDLGDQTKATDGFAFDLNAPGRGPIEWLIGQNDLFVGFSGAEWIVNSGSTNSNGGSSGSAISATSINATENSTWGSAAAVEPVIAGSALLFTQRQANSIQQLVYSIYETRYKSQDLTVLSDHLFAAGIVQMDYMTRWRKQSILWTVTKQGELCGVTYDRDQEIFGWHVHRTGFGQLDFNGIEVENDPGFESVATLFGNLPGYDDEVWVVANRIIQGVNQRFIELLNPYNWEEAFSGPPTAPAPSLPDAFYIDCGITIENPGALALTGLNYLEGRFVVGLADGNAFGPLDVNGGSVLLPSWVPTTVAKVQIGLAVPYAAQPMRIDQDYRAGNTQALVKSLSDIFIRVYNSVGGEISNGTEEYPPFVPGTSYAAGDNVISPLTLLAYQCVVSTSSSTDPANNSAQWLNIPKPVFNQPVPIPYTTTDGTPFGQRMLVTTPKDIRMTPMPNQWPDNDPIFIVQGKDALPITVLAATLKYSITGEP